MSEHHARVVIIGAGYAGRLAASRAAGKGVHLTVIDASQALQERVRLHQRLVGRLPAPRALASYLPKRAELVTGYATGVDLGAQRVRVEAAAQPARDLAYDHLILAMGSADATPPASCRSAVSLSQPDAPERVANAVAAGTPLFVVGGGSTGVEVAAELAEVYPEASVTLVAGKALLPGSAPATQAAARVALTLLGVDVRDGARLVACDGSGVTLRTGSGDAGEHGLAIWCAGLQSSPALPGLRAGAPDGRFEVDATLRLRGSETVWACGDASAAIGADGLPLRRSCAAAMPLGATCGANVRRTLLGRPLRESAVALPALTVSIGTRAGIVEARRLDQGTRLLLTGRAAVAVKHAILPLTTAVTRWERNTGLPWYPEMSRSRTPAIEYAESRQL